MVVGILVAGMTVAGRAAVLEEGTVDHNPAAATVEAAARTAAGTCWIAEAAARVYLAGLATEAVGMMAVVRHQVVEVSTDSVGKVVVDKVLALRKMVALIQVASNLVVEGEDMAMVVQV